MGNRTAKNAAKTSRFEGKASKKPFSKTTNLRQKSKQWENSRQKEALKEILAFSAICRYNKLICYNVFCKRLYCVSKIIGIAGL
jgi:hypothetical protein